MSIAKDDLQEAAKTMMKELNYMRKNNKIFIAKYPSCKMKAQVF